MSPLQDAEQQESLARWSLPEIVLLRQLARFQLDDAAAQTARALLAQGVDWELFYREAATHGVSALVFRQLAGPYRELVPAQWLDQFKKSVLSTTQFNLGILRELLVVHDELDRLGVPHLFFKGLVMAQSLYQDLSARRCGDIDVLVQPRHFPEAKAYFIREGFVQTLTDKQEMGSLQSGLWHERRNVNIDLHFGVPPLEMAVPVAPLFQRSRRIVMAGREIPVFDACDMMVTYCGNAVKEFWNQRLYHYADLHAMISTQTCDWQRLWESAKQLESRRATVLALSMLHKIYDISLPEMPRYRLSKATMELESRFFAVKQENPLEGRNRLLVLPDARSYLALLIDNPMRRFLYGKGKFLVPNDADFTLLRLPDNLRFLYVVVRPLRLLVKFIGKFFQGSS